LFEKAKQIYILINQKNPLCARANLKVQSLHNTNHATNSKITKDHETALNTIKGSNSRQSN